MKKLTRILCIVFFAVCMICVPAACHVNTPSSGTGTGAEKYSVRFYDGDKLVSSVQTAGNEAIEAPALNAPAHYTFAGWYWDKDTWQNPFSENDYAQKPVTSDLSVYAKWTQTEFEVTFEENGGSAVADTGNWFQTIASEPQTSRTHFRFDGWFETPDFSTPRVNFPYSPAANVTLYAKWTQTEFEVTFEENGGSAVQDGWFGVIEKAPATDRGGFILEGWYTDPSLSKKAVFPLTLTENVTLYAKWNAAPALLAAEGFTLSGKTATSETVYTENTQTIDLSQAFTVSEGAQWKLYEDADCLHEVTASAVPLNAGTNRFYLKVSVGSQAEVYELVLKKTGGYALTVYENGEESTTVYANKGDTFEKPQPKLYTKNFRFDGEYFTDALLTIPFDNFKADGDKTVYMKIWYVGFDYSKSIFTIDEALPSDKPILYAKIPAEIDGSPVYFLSSSFQNNFSFKRNLKEVVVEKGVRTIANSAFYYSDQLEKVTLPDGIMLAGGVFSSCPKLAEVVCDGVIRSSSTNFYNTALYKNEENWENGALHIGKYLADFDEAKITTPAFKVKDGTLSISGGVFSYKSDAPVQVTSFDFGNTVKYIGSYAFDRAKSITSFTGMDAVESIGADAFRDTGYFNAAGNWQNNLLYLNHWLIASDSFAGALKLQEGTVGIADKVFSGNTELTSVDFGTSLAYIGKYAFGSDYSPKGGILTEVSFPASLRLIDDYAFCYQTKLTSIHFEEGLEYIDDSAFRNCNAAGDVIVPASVKTICRSGLQLSSANRLFLRGAFKDIYAENEWNGYSFSTVKPTPYYEYSDSQKSGYWHFNSDGLPELWS